MRIQIITLFFAFAVLTSCIKEKPLPVLGEREIRGSDTTYHTIRDFAFVNQDSVIVTNKTFDNHIYIADFFFTSCRTICPIMKSNMLNVYEAFKNDDNVLILSHTIDPEYDTVALLHDYANRLGVSSKKWHFVTGVKDSIYSIAEKSYFSTAREDDQDPDGFLHSGAFVLVDKKRRIRGIYDGTKDDKVEQLIRDVKRLQTEKP